MKKFLLPAAVVLFAFGCDYSNESDNVQREKADTVVAPPKENISTYSEGFQKIVKTSDGVFRGVTLGMTMSEVKKVESNSQAEGVEPNHLDYMVDYGELEEAEVNYDFNDFDRLSSIEVNVYPKSKESQDSIYFEFEKYFIKRHGAATQPDQNSRKWENKEQNLLVVMEKKDTQKVHDIIIRFSELSNEVSSLLDKEDTSIE